MLGISILFSMFIDFIYFHKKIINSLIIKKIRYNRKIWWISTYCVGATKHRITKPCKRQGKHTFTHTYNIHTHLYKLHKTNFTWVTWYLTWGYCKEIKSLDTRQGVHLDTRHRWKIILFKECIYDCSLHIMLRWFKFIYNHIVTSKYGWIRYN